MYPSEAERVEKAVEEAAAYIAQFRADNIVEDAEYIKDALLLPAESEVC